MKFQQLARVQSELEYLRNLPQVLKQLGIHENFLAETQCILDEIKQGQNYFEQSLNELRINQQKIAEDKKFIQNTQDSIKSTLSQVEETLKDLEYIKNLPRKLDELGITEGAIQRINELLGRSLALSKRLEKLNQEMIFVRDLENYLGSFHQYRSGKQLRHFLYQELGFAGLVVYVLHLLRPRRRNR